MSLVTLAEVKAVGRIDYSAHDAILQMLIDALETFVEEHCCIKLSSAEYTDERCDGGHEQLWPKNLPLTEVDEIKDAWSGDEVQDADDYFLQDTRIVVEDGGVWGDGELRWKVTYTAGYTEATAPKGLKPLLIGLVLLAYDNPDGKSSRAAKGFGVNWEKLATDNNLIYQLDHFSLRRYME